MMKLPVWCGAHPSGWAGLQNALPLITTKGIYNYLFIFFWNIKIPSHGRFPLLIAEHRIRTKGN
jgi:hypothetical protein